MNYSEKHFEEQEEIRLENTQAQLRRLMLGLAVKIATVFSLGGEG